MREIQLLNLNVSKYRVDYEYRVSDEVACYFNEPTMYAEYTTQVDCVPRSILAIPFVANVLPVVWLSDSILWIEELDRTFYECIHRLKAAFQDLYPKVQLRGRVVVARLIDNTYSPCKESALLFSGGIDAHVSFLRLKDTNPLLINIQGWYRSIPNERQVSVAEAQRSVIGEFAEVQNVEFEFIKSNFAVFLNSRYFDKKHHRALGDSLWHGFQHSMNFITLSMPIAYVKGIHNIYIASSFSLGHYGQCASYPTTDNEYRFAEVGRCIHDAFELSRQDKVRYLVQYQKESGKPYPVNVCSFNDKNCCECDKCFRSVLEIVAENGDLASFGFDVPSDLKAYYADVMSRRIREFGIKGEMRKHWPDSILRMKQNYNFIEQKEFVDWFLSYDFMKAKRVAVYRYYRTNIVEILKRKLLKR